MQQADNVVNSIPSARRTGASLRSTMTVARESKRDERLRDQRLALIHRQRERLEHEVVAVAVHDQAGQPVALAPERAGTERGSITASSGGTRWPGAIRRRKKSASSACRCRENRRATICETGL